MSGLEDDKNKVGTLQNNMMMQNNVANHMQNNNPLGSLINNTHVQNVNNNQMNNNYNFNNNQNVNSLSSNISSNNTLINQLQISQMLSWPTSGLSSNPGSGISFSPLNNVSSSGFPDLPKFVSPTQGMSPVNNPALNNSQNNSQNPLNNLSPNQLNTNSIIMTGLSPQPQPMNNTALQKVLANANGS